MFVLGFTNAVGFILCIYKCQILKIGGGGRDMNNCAVNSENFFFVFNLFNQFDQ